MEVVIKAAELVNLFEVESVIKAAELLNLFEVEVVIKAAELPKTFHVHVHHCLFSSNRVKVYRSPGTVPHGQFISA